jgi:hypothetical protein
MSAEFMLLAIVVAMVGILSGPILFSDTALARWRARHRDRTVR